MKGYDGGGSPRPRGSQPCRCRRPLSFVYGLMSHCIDRFYFVFYLYTFHFMLPMCIRLIFLVVFSMFLLFMFLFILFIFHVFISFPQVHLLVPGTTPVNCVLPLQMEHCHFVCPPIRLRSGALPFVQRLRIGGPPNWRVARIGGSP